MAEIRHASMRDRKARGIMMAANLNSSKTHQINSQRGQMNGQLAGVEMSEIITLRGSLLNLSQTLLVPLEMPPKFCLRTNSKITLTSAQGKTWQKPWDLKNSDPPSGNITSVFKTLSATLFDTNVWQIYISHCVYKYPTVFLQEPDSVSEKCSMSRDLT